MLINGLATAIPTEFQDSPAITTKSQLASDLGFIAANALIKEQGLKPDQIGVLVFVSQTPDYRSPATACVLQHRLGVPEDCIVFDVNLSGVGFISGMNIVCSLLANLNSLYGILVVGDTLSKQLDPMRNNQELMVGDGAAAIIVEKRDSPQILRYCSFADSNRFATMIIPGGAFRSQNITARVLSAEDDRGSSRDSIVLDYPRFKEYMLREIPTAFQDFCKKTGSRTEDFDFVTISQFSQEFVEELSSRMHLPSGKVLENYTSRGYIGAGSIPLLISDHYGHVKGNKCSRVLACGLGEGLSWGFADFTICADAVLPVIETDDFYLEGAVSHDI